MKTLFLSAIIIASSLWAQAGNVPVGSIAQSTGALIVGLKFSEGLETRFIPGTFCAATLIRPNVLLTAKACANKFAQLQNQYTDSNVVLSYVPHEKEFGQVNFIAKVLTSKTTESQWALMVLDRHLKNAKTAYLEENIRRYDSLDRLSFAPNTNDPFGEQPILESNLDPKSSRLIKSNGEYLLTGKLLVLGGTIREYRKVPGDRFYKWDYRQVVVGVVVGFKTTLVDGTQQKVAIVQPIDKAAIEQLLRQ